jgi:ferric-dicitrate binding protein FerR (iron transport regulator)
VSDPIERIGRALADADDAELAKQSELDVAAARRRFLDGAAAAEMRRGAPARRRWIAGVAIGGAVAASLALGWLMRSDDPALEYRIAGEDAPSPAGRWLASTDDGVECRFTDGSRVTLEPGSDARVAQLTAEGAEIALERGALDVDIVPREDAAWAVHAGPFSVRVVGTAFRVRWDPDEARFSVEMVRGEVELHGPEIEGQRASRTDRVEVWGREGRLEVTRGGAIAALESEEEGAGEEGSVRRPSIDLRDEAPGLGAGRDGERAGSSGASAADREERAARAGGARGASDPAAAPTWQDLARDGRYVDAIALVEARGWEAAIGRSSPAEVIELGDTARLAGRAELADRAYRVARQRFARTPTAARAAFLLGRLAFDAAPAEAARWFETAARENPEGPLARESLGRALEAHRAAGDVAEARSSAARYLDRYPEGPHAALAASLLARGASE